jgi:hypothetical protein
MLLPVGYQLTAVCLNSVMAHDFELRQLLLAVISKVIFGFKFH